MGVRGLLTCDDILWRILPSNAAVLAALRAGSASNSGEKTKFSSSDKPARMRNEDSLAEMRALMAALGMCPELLCDSLSVIHVAGTKGKGSTAAYAETVARAHGRRTLLFTSPHLVHARERVRVDGRALELADFEARVVGLYARLVDAGATPPGFFRFMTLLFFDVCAEVARPVAVVEVGMGGRYDATNVLPLPSAAVVTSLAMEHVSALGPTLADIARHKAGVAKRGVPLLHARQNDATDDVVAAECAAVGALYEAVDAHCLAPTDHGAAKRLLFLGIGEGEHAVRNAALAFSACRHALKDSFDSETALRSLSAARMPGRQQIVSHGAATWFLDGAHTPESVAICARWFAERTQNDAGRDTQRVLVFYCASDKDAERMLGALATLALDRAIFVLPSMPKDAEHVTAAYAQSLADVFRQCVDPMPSDCDRLPSTCPDGPLSAHRGSLQIEVLSSVAQAVAAIGDAPANVLVTGSLYIVGDALRELSAPVN